MLYIIATPIGNKDDITLRAINILKEADILLAEDSRQLRKLCKLHNIRFKRIIVYNDNNKKRITPKILDLLKSNDIALTTDSGTPCISDPGHYLVRACIKNKLQISPIPGPSALISALSVSPLPTDRFTFYGFFPKKKSKQEEIIKLLNLREETGILYESPHRIEKTLNLFKEKIPNHYMFIAREMTKKFEEFKFDKIKDIQIPKSKGEFVLIIKK